MTEWIRRFSQGVGWAISGFSFLFSGPKLLPLSLIPALVATGFLIFGVVWGFENLGPMLTSLAPIPTGPISTFLHWSVQVLGTVFFGIGLLLTTVIASKIIVVPFNSLLAEKTLKYVGAIQEQPFRLRSWLRKSGRLLLITLTQVVFFSIVGIGILILSIVPFVQFFTWYLGLLIVAFDCADYSLECTALGFREKLSLIRTRLPEFSGFALVLGVIFMIPVVNFIFLPVSIIGAARMVASFQEAWKVKSP